MQSGYALNPCWSFQESPYARALEVAQLLGFHGRNPQCVLEFYKNKTGEELVAAIGLLRHFSKEVFFHELFSKFNIVKK